MSSYDQLHRYRWEQTRDWFNAQRLPSGPVGGTDAWLALPDDDPRKLAALARLGVVRVLLLELDELTMLRRLCEASKDVAEGTDWTAEARRIRQHDDARSSGAYIPRKESA